MRPPINNLTSAPDVTDSPTALPVVRISKWFEIRRMKTNPKKLEESHKLLRELRDWNGERVWMNPPYGREIGLWMKKAYEASLAGALVVCLVPARTDTHWWHEYAMKGKIEFLRGRVKFVGGAHSAPFPSAVVTLTPYNHY